MADDSGERSGTPAGLSYLVEFVSGDEERALLDLFDQMEFHHVVMRGKESRRAVRHFGYEYEYESRRLVPTEPLPLDLHWLLYRAADLVGHDQEYFDQTLISHYAPGATIGWHRDAPMFGSCIVGVSLMSDCRICFRRTDGGETVKIAQPLARCSAYSLCDQARWTWQHAIPATKHPRFSVTFRTLRRERAA
jgi:alkylated DNA repair dioxygenase AlkB